MGSLLFIILNDLTLATSRLVLIFWGWWGRSLAILSRRSHAAERTLVKDQSGRAPLETRITTLAGPVAVARLAERHVTVGIVLAERVLLATLNGLGPVASVLLFVIKETANAELFGGGSVPAGPVADARRLVTEDAVFPVARASADGSVGKLLVVAGIASPRVVAVLEETAAATGENQAIGAVKQLGFAVHALPVTVAVSHVGHHLTLCLARIRLRYFLGHAGRDGHGENDTNESLHGCGV